MKKILIVVSFFLAIFTLSACDTLFNNGSVEPVDTYTLTLQTEAEGVTLSETPQGPHEAGDSVEISAEWGDEALVFARWEEEGSSLSDEATFTYTVDGDATLTAVFIDHDDDEDVNVEISASHEGVEFDTTPEGPYEVGDTLTVTPLFDTSLLAFKAWMVNGSEVSTELTLKYTLEGNTSIEAIFERIDVEPRTYHETFEDFYSTGSQYSNFSHVGTSGIEWHFTDTRTDVRFDNVSEAVTFGNVPQRNASMTATIPEGIRAFSVYYENAYSSPAGLELYINDELIATAPEVDGTIGLFEVNDLDITGEFEFRLVPTSGQTTIDDLMWENNVPGSDYPVVTLESDYWDAHLEVSPSARVAPGEEVTVTASDTEELYNFLYWEDAEGNTVSEDNPYTFALETDTVLNAVFDNPPAYLLRLESNYYRAELDKSIDHNVIEGTEIVVSVNDPDNQYDFIGWEAEDGTFLSEDETFTYTMVASDTLLKAIFDVPEPIDFTNKTLEELTALELDRFGGYYTELEGLYGGDLADALQMMLQTRIVYQSYDDARDILQISDRDPNNHDNVMLIYTRLSVPGEWDGGTTWNREHVWPSRRFPGERTSNLGSDLHNLAPANPSENSSRGYKYFDWETTASSYEPHDDVKGDVARMMFYMDVLYDELTLVDDAPNADNYEMGNLGVMLQWHVLDEVSHFEMHRNDVIEDYQNNRNPFIDYPHLAYLLYYNHPEVALD